MNIAHIHTYIAYIHTYMYAYIITYIQTYMHRLHTYIHTYMRTHMHTLLRTYIHAYIHSYNLIHTFTYTCACFLVELSTRQKWNKNLEITFRPMAVRTHDFIVDSAAHY